jgi:PPP family 3-phenylpropionic acid transporter
VPGRLHPLRVYYFASFAAGGAFLPYFATWLEARGVDGLGMGVVVGMLPAMGVLGPPAIGLFADVLDLRGSLLRVACLGAALSMLALAAAGTISAGATGAPSFVAILAATTAYAVFRAPLAMLADVVALERARAAGTTYGELRLWGSLGFMIAVFLVGRVLDPRAPALLPATIAGLLGVAFVAALPLPAKPATPKLPVAREARALLGSTPFAIFLATALLANLAHAAYDLCFSLHVRDLGGSPAMMGATWAIGVLTEVVFLAFAERLTTSVPAPRIVMAALLGAALRWMLIAYAPSVTVLLLLAPLHAVSYALWWVASLAFVKERAPGHALATAQGLFTAAVAAGSVIGMVTWGALYRRAGGAVVFSAAATISLGASLVALAWNALHRKSLAEGKTFAPVPPPG